MKLKIGLGPEDLHPSKLGIMVKFQCRNSGRLVKEAFPETIMKDEEGLVGMDIVSRGQVKRSLHGEKPRCLS